MKSRRKSRARVEGIRNASPQFNPIIPGDWVPLRFPFHFPSLVSFLPSFRSPNWPFHRSNYLSLLPAFLEVTRTASENVTSVSFERAVGLQLVASVGRSKRRSFLRWIISKRHRLQHGPFKSSLSTGNKVFCSSKSSFPYILYQAIINFRRGRSLFLTHRAKWKN